MFRRVVVEGGPKTTEAGLSGPSMASAQ